MNREILFKGFNEDKNGNEEIELDGKIIKGKWVFGSLIYDVNKKWYIHENNCALCIGFHEIISETICQYTGLDNNYNQKIFEHDILRDYSTEIEDWKVSYEYGKFVGTCDNVCEDLWELHDLEVIGTIYDIKEVIVN